MTNIAADLQAIQRDVDSISRNFTALEAVLAERDAEVASLRAKLNGQFNTSAVLAERDAEIARLKEKVAELIGHWNTAADLAKQRLQRILAVERLLKDEIKDLPADGYLAGVDWASDVANAIRGLKRERAERIANSDSAVREQNLDLKKSHKIVIKALNTAWKTLSVKIVGEPEEYLNKAWWDCVAEVIDRLKAERDKAKAEGDSLAKALQYPASDKSLAEKNRRLTRLLDGLVKLNNGRLLLNKSHIGNHGAFLVDETTNQNHIVLKSL